MKPRFYGDAELAGMGYVRARDGVLLDNRDGFFTDNSGDFLRTYDCRTFVAVRRSLLWKLLDALERLP
jgi:hypothetical protein